MLSRRPVNRREWSEEEREHLVDVSVGRRPIASLLPVENVRCGCGAWVKRGDPSSRVVVVPEGFLRCQFDGGRRRALKARRAAAWGSDGE